MGLRQWIGLIKTGGYPRVLVNMGWTRLKRPGCYMIDRGTEQGFVTEELAWIMSRGRD